MNVPKQILEEEKKVVQEPIKEIEILIDDFSYIPLHMILHFDPQENLHCR